MSDKTVYTLTQNITGWLAVTSFICGVLSAAFGAFYGVMGWDVAWRWSMGIAAACGVIFAGAFVAALAVFQKT